MESIRLLDCTLRDGGYVNDWLFGFDDMQDILQKSFASNVDIVEIGFIRADTYNPDRAVFCSMQQVQSLIENKKSNNNIQTAVMAEISNPIPLDMVEPSERNDIDIVRVIVWKSRRNADGKFVDTLKDSYEYCKGFVEKGYKLCVQPNRSNQYTEDEFKNMLKMFAELSPMAIYVVDSWGTMYSDEVLKYMEMADKVLPKNISIGFHGHNNMQQAFSNAEKIVERNFERNIILDASVYGIGRGAGNLSLELIARFLNKSKGRYYNIEPLLEIYDRHIRQLREKCTWGSSMPFFISADADSNPDYASYYEGKLSATEMKNTLAKMNREQQIIFAKAIAEQYLQK